MTYVIQRQDGAYATPSGSAKSYTGKLQFARMFGSKESADRELCPENECVISLEEAVGIHQYR